MLEKRENMLEMIKSFEVFFKNGEIKLREIKPSVTSSNNTPYVANIEYKGYSSFNDSNTIIKIYYNGKLERFNLNGWVFPHTFEGRIHSPGSYSSCEFRLEDVIHNKFKSISKDFTFRFESRDFSLRGTFSTLLKDISTHENYLTIIFNYLYKISCCKNVFQVEMIYNLDSQYRFYIETRKRHDAFLSNKQNENYFKTCSNIFKALEILKEITFGETPYFYGNDEYSRFLVDELKLKGLALHNFVSRLIKTEADIEFSV